MDMDDIEDSQACNFGKTQKSDEDDIPSTSQSAKGSKITLAAKFDTPFTKSSQNKISQPTQENPSNNKKKPPMRTASDVINRIKHDDSLSPEDFCVGYEDRFVGLIEKSFAEFDWDTNIAGSGPDIFCIPQHRIQYFKRHNVLVWDKKTRLDNVFGSTAGCVKISDSNTVIQASDESPKDDISGKQNLDDSMDDGHVCDTDSSRPNYFIGMVIDSPSVIASVTAFQKKLQNMAKEQNEYGAIKRACVPTRKLHITLCVCKLDAKDLPTVIQATRLMFAESPAIHVEFRAIKKFGENVVYAVPHSSQLYQYGISLQKKLGEIGINMQANFQPYKPHLTLMKCRGELPQPITQILESKDFSKWVFKDQVLNRIVLCKIRSTAPGGFYETLATFPLNDQEEIYRPFNNKPGKTRKRHRIHEKKRSNSSNHSHKSEHRDVSIGKGLAAVLRHNKFGFEVDSVNEKINQHKSLNQKDTFAAGFVEVKEILKHQYFYESLRVTKEDIHRVVATNDKRRFEIVANDSGCELIRATQGHSVEVEDLDLQEITDPSEYPNVVHGTFWKFWQQILHQGLHRRKRIHIHMTTAEPTDKNTVISGMRKSCNVFVYVDIAAAMADGLRFFVSTNGVILSPGDDMGYIAPRYFSKVTGTSKTHRIELLNNTQSGEILNANDFKATSDHAKTVEADETKLDSAPLHGDFPEKTWNSSSSENDDEVEPDDPVNQDCEVSAETWENPTNDTDDVVEPDGRVNQDCEVSAETWENPSNENEGETKPHSADQFTEDETSSRSEQTSPDLVQPHL